MERRHPHTHLLAQRVRILQEGVEPVPLQLVALVGQDRRSKGPTQLGYFGLLIEATHAINVLDQRIAVIISEPGPGIGWIAVFVVGVVVRIGNHDAARIVRTHLFHEISPIGRLHRAQLVHGDLHALIGRTHIRMNIQQSHINDLKTFLVVILVVLLPVCSHTGEVLHAPDNRGRKLIRQILEISRYRAFVPCGILKGNARLIDHMTGNTVFLTDCPCASVEGQLVRTRMHGLTRHIIVDQAKDEGRD